MEPAYRTGVAARNFAFDVGAVKASEAGRPVISVGNITTGGTGKTPLVIDLAQRLVDRGHRPAVLLRGYRTHDGLSDEAQVIRSTLGQAAYVEVDPNRVAACRRVISSDPRVDVFLLDDGFQHRALKRDLDLVLIDATNPFGFGRVLPRGLLREPIANLRRADAVIITRSDQVKPETLRAVDQKVEAITSRPPIAHTVQAWSGFRDASSRRLDLQAIRGRRVMGVCGIGNPSGFERSLRDGGADVVDWVVKPDHHRYTQQEVLELAQSARGLGAEFLVTTEKDWVKWQVMARVVTAGIAVLRPVLQVCYLDGQERLMTAVETCLNDSKSAVLPRESDQSRRK